MGHILSNWRRRFTSLLTLRWRLTLWTAGLFLLLGLGLALFINSMTAFQVPQVIRMELVPTQQPLSDEPAVLPTRLPETHLPPTEPPDAQTTGLQEIVIRQVRFISLLGIGLFTLVGSIGAYWIAKHSLRPVRCLSQSIQLIQAQTLHQRLPVADPPDEVKELATAFNQMLARLEKAFEQQNRFVADAAHELRTPLTTLHTNLEVIENDTDATLADYKETAKVLKRALGRLELLVEDLLLLARGEKEIHLEPIEVEVLLNEIIEEVRQLALLQQVEIKLEINEPVTLLVDTPLLGRVVSNLLQNGIRYNRPGGSVTITVYRVINGVEISVKDTGIGIPEEMQPYVFERFYRVDQSRAREHGGYGLGLSIAAHIVQLHGGDIKLHSIPGEGSIFTVFLPDIEKRYARSPKT